jgi:L-alanine-DL-glutamate epimerase-like enolase superfamily enzyme
MKITEVEPIHLRIPDVEDVADGTQDVLVVLIHTDAGVTGIGEAASQSYVAKAVFEAPRSAQRRHGLRHLLIGQDPLDEGLWDHMYHHTNRYGRRGVAIHAISAADIALWDIRGKVEGKPLYELLGGSYRKSVRAYASYLFGETPEATARLARDAVELGLTAVKFGWEPFGKDPAVDVAHIEAARGILGDASDLMVDAGHAWDHETALERARLFERFHLGWLEEPLKQDDRKGYQRLCSQSPVPIAAGEGDMTPWDFEDLIERGLHVIQPDVAFCGGPTVCRKVSAMAAEAGRRCVPHCFSTGINLTASLHWMASTPDGDLVEYCLRDSPLMRKLVKNLPPLENGRAPVPQGPGLGIELDAEIVEKYRVSYK